MKAPQWHIIGAGAIGCLFAEALHTAGHSPTLILRGKSSDEAPLVIVEREDSRIEFTANTQPPDGDEPISHLLVTTKAYDVYGAVADVAHRLSPDSVVLLLANGMGFTERVAKAWPELNLFVGMTTEGAYRLGPQHIRHAGLGETRIGHSKLPGRPPWFDEFEVALQRCVWDSLIDEALWMKLAVNCVINPMTAFHGCLNGELARRPELAERVAPLCEEVAAVCRAQGFHGVAAALRDTVDAVIAGTAENRSSMLQDLEAERPTEIHFINGFLIEVAQRHGIDVPRNRELVEEISRREP